MKCTFEALVSKQRSTAAGTGQVVATDNVTWEGSDEQAAQPTLQAVKIFPTSSASERLRQLL